MWIETHIPATHHRKRMIKPMDDDYYYDSYDGGMVSDSATRKTKSSDTKINLPTFRRFTKRVAPTEFGSIMGSLTFGMLLIFPAIALLTMAAPAVIFTIIAFIFIGTWLFSQRFRLALIVLGISVAPILLGFISLGIYMAIFNS